MASKSFSSHMRGFTLIEISIVLVVIGLLISGGLLGIAPVLEQAKRTQTENTLTKIEDALLLYAMQNSCLPCPADGTSPGANEGLTLNNVGTPYTGCTTTACRGELVDNVVPWQSLGLQRADAIDEWGTQITYHLSETTNATQGTAPATCDNLADSAVATGTGGFTRSGTTFPQGCLNVEDTNSAAFVTNTVQAAYVLISHGPDTSGGFASNTGNGTRTNNQQATNTVQIENNLGACDDGAGPAAPTPCHQGDPIGLSDDTYFDDVVRWKTAPIIVFQCGDGACGNP